MNIFQSSGLINLFRTFRVDDPLLPTFVVFESFFRPLGWWPLFPALAVIESFFQPSWLMNLFFNLCDWWTFSQPVRLMTFPFSKPLCLILFPVVKLTIHFWNPLTTSIFWEITGSLISIHGLMFHKIKRYNLACISWPAFAINIPIIHPNPSRWTRKSQVVIPISHTTVLNGQIFGYTGI